MGRGRKSKTGSPQPQDEKGAASEKDGRGHLLHDYIQEHKERAKRGIVDIRTLDWESGKLSSTLSSTVNFLGDIFLFVSRD